jgi:hypothetical protein
MSLSSAVSGPLGLVSHRGRLVYNESKKLTTVSSALMEACMPRFLGRKTHRIWLDVVALVVLVLLVILVLELTGTTHIFT